MTSVLNIDYSGFDTIPAYSIKFILIVSLVQVLDQGALREAVSSLLVSRSQMLRLLDVVGSLMALA